MLLTNLVLLKYIEYGVYGILSWFRGTSASIYLRGAVLLVGFIVDAKDGWQEK